MCHGHVQSYLAGGLWHDWPAEAHTPGRLIGVRETAARLDVPVSTLYKHWREWQLTAYRVGRALKFRERDIETWLERQRVGGVA